MATRLVVLFIKIAPEGEINPFNPPRHVARQAHEKSRQQVDAPNISGRIVQLRGVHFIGKGD
jgi:hypothetical protein